MASALFGSFPKASSITTGGSCRSSKKCANKYYAGSYASRASWNKTEKLPQEYCILKSSQNNLKYQNFKSIEVMGSKSDKCERKYLMNATSAESHESESHESELQAHHVSKGILELIKDAMDVYFKFSRPYVTIASVLGATSASLLAVEKLSDISPAFFISLFQYAAAFHFMLVYHTGLNELVDVEIDKINKPHFAMASGQYSSKIGVIVTALCLFMSLGFGWMVGSKPILWALLACFVLGTAYSANLPLLRWKRFTVLTLAYLIGHPISVNLASFLHVKTHVLKRAATLSRSMILSLAMMGAYSTVIALAKDIPDIEGDKAGGIQTLAVRIGAKRVLWFCVSLLEMAYGVGILVGATSPFLWSKIVTVVAHSIKALVLWYNAKSLDLKSKVATQSFYMTIFKLYCAEAIIIALTR